MLAELQKLDGLPVIRGDQEEEEASYSLPFPSDNGILKMIEMLSKILVTLNNGTFQEAEEDSEDASDLDKELFNDPDTQEIIRNLVL